MLMCCLIHTVCKLSHIWSNSNYKTKTALVIHAELVTDEEQLICSLVVHSVFPQVLSFLPLDLCAYAETV